MAITDEQLKGMAAQALNMAKRDLEQDDFNFLLASYHESDVPPLYRMRDVEARIVARLGKDWLNHGRTKAAAFYMLRMATDMLPPDAFLFATAGNGFTPTAKFHALPPEQQQEIFDSGHDRHHEAVRQGLYEICDVLVATVQTPERVCFYQQKLNRRGEFIDKPEARFSSQEDFDGRLKMFGTPTRTKATTT